MAKEAKKVVSRERLLALLFIGLLGFLLGAGTIRLAILDIAPMVVEVPYLRNPAAAKPGSAVLSEEYRFSCYQAKLLKAETRKTLDAALKRGGWNLTADASTRVCDTPADGRLLVVADDCADDGCTTAALLLYEPGVKALRTLFKKETGSQVGAAIIDDILSWNRDGVTARVTDTVLETPCDDSALRGKPAYQDVNVAIADGSLTVRKSCTYVACDAPVQCRVQQ